ncbi:MAG: inositol monophosphatase [Rhodospirillales bacterium]|nr:inositol monophosphatase [Rhodospirillales bacterium]QQS15210.1 MAG: inositol monophosphatase [Rhodospirillales bacterium]
MTVMARAAFAAAKGLKRDFGEVEHLQFTEKSAGDFVSKADIMAQRVIREHLMGMRPDYGFLGEEGANTPGDGRNRWIVDPLDGTTNFMHGVPHFAVSIALEREGEVVAGLILNPATDDLFWAEKGAGAFLETPSTLRSRRLRVAGRKSTTSLLLATGIPFAARGEHEEFLATLRRAMKSTSGVRRFGAAALDLAWVATGRFDGFWEFGLSPWDVAAGVLLVREAGGVVTDLEGAPYALGGPSILATNLALRDTLTGLLTRD